MIEKTLHFFYGDNDTEVFSIMDGTMEKRASYSSEVQEYLDKLASRDDKTYALVNALSSGEYYGSNRNGDYFPEKALKDYHKTFEAMGHVYIRHINKDPKKALGSVKLAHYNDKMKRVELVLELDNAKAEPLLKRLDKGELPAVSMGCKVPKDTCSICGNEATKIANYCEHLKDNMNKVMPNGKKVYAINNQPKFFDISVVTIPAEKTASFIKKISGKKAMSFDKSANGLNDMPLTWAQSFAKTASLESQAEIKKKIDGKIEAISEDPKKLILELQKRLSKGTIEKLSKYPLGEVLSTFIGLRIMPIREDFQKLALYSMGKAEGAELLEQNNICFVLDPALKATFPDDISLNHFNEKIAGLLKEELSGMMMTKSNIVARGLLKISQVGSTETTQIADELKSAFPERTKRERSMISKVFFGQSEDPDLNSMKSPIVPLGILGSLYYGYIKTFNNVNTGEFKKFLARHPWIFTAMLGTAAGASMMAQKRHIRKSEALDKQAGLIENSGHILGSLIITVPASYYAASFPEQKARKGIPISSSEDFLRKHPALVALGASILGVTGYGTLTKQFKKLKTWDPGIAKLSHVLTQLDEESLDIIYNDLIIN